MEKTIDKKRLRVVLAALVALALAACAVPAVAALAENASLPDSTGTLHIHKYIGYDIDKAGQANDGNELSSDAVSKINESFEAGSDITFRIYKVSANANGDYPGAAPYRLDGTTLKDGAGDEFTVSAAATPSVTTGSDGSAVTGDLPQGVYLVVEDASEKVALPADPFVVAVPMTNSAGDGWIQDVHVYPKNETLEIDKDLKAGTKDDAAAKTQTGTSVNVGDTIPYTITPSLPSEIVAYTKNADGTPPTAPITSASLTKEDSNIKYYITDVLDEALTYTDGSVKVYGIKSTDNEKTGGTLVSQSGNYTTSLESSTNTLKIDFTAAGRLALYNGAYNKLRIEFDAVVNNKVLAKKVHEIGNKASVNFVNKFNPEDPFTKETPEVKVHTGSIDITKCDATNTKSLLKDAKFKIADSEEHAKAGVYLQKTADGAIVDNNDSRYVPDDHSLDYEVTTDSDGKAAFEGLEDYTSTIAADGTETTNYCTYWLVETQAPDGFNLPNAPFSVSFDADSSKQETNWVKSVSITNTNEFTLPLTGGMGTMLLTLAGILLVGGAGCAFFAANRKKKKAQAE